MRREALTVPAIRPSRALTPQATLRAALVVGTWLAAGAVPAEGQPDPERMPSVELPAELDRVLREYEQAWQASDADALARLFAEDGFVMSAATPPLRGRGRIRKHYEGSGGALHLRALSYGAQGDVGFIIGAYGISPDRDFGKFILALRRGADGRWLIAADMDNAS